MAGGTLRAAGLVTARTATYALVILTLVSVLKNFDRSLFGLVTPLIIDDLGLTDVDVGLLGGLIFVLPNVLLGLPVGWLADRYSRRNIIAAALAFWSLATGATALVGTHAQMLTARLLTGAGEAGAQAPSNSLLADFYGGRRRTLAVAVLISASAINFLLLYPLAGWVATRYGWRVPFLLGGVAGVALALLMLLTLREPQRGAADKGTAAAPAPPFRDTLRYLHGARSYGWLLGGAALMGAQLYIASTWGVTFLVRAHGMELGEIANVIGPVRGVFSAIGILGGAALTVRLCARDERWRLWLPAVAAALIVPAEFAYLFGEQRAVWLTGQAALNLLSVLYLAPVQTVCLEIAGVRRRATATAILLLCSGLLGPAVGPALVGLMSELLNEAQGVHSLRYAMLLAAACAAAAALCFLFAARHLRADMLRGSASLQSSTAAG